jgi:hypothetical protein
LRLDPTGEAEVAEGRHDEIWKPVPAEGYTESKRKEPIAGHPPGIVPKFVSASILWKSNIEIDTSSHLPHATLQ